MLCYTALTLLAMLASQRHANHAWHTKVLVVKLPETQELIDHCFLLR
jgi:hypothetical protein